MMERKFRDRRGRGRGIIAIAQVVTMITTMSGVATAASGTIGQTTAGEMRSVTYGC